MQERPREALAPIVVSLAQERAHVEPPRIAEHRDEEVDAHLSASDEHTSLAEIDLQLMTRRRLEANRRHLRGAPSLAMRRDRSLQRPQLHVDPSLTEQLPRDHRVAGRSAVEQRHGHRALSGVEPSCSRPLLRSRRRTAQVSPGGTTADSERRGDALGTPAHRG